MVWVIATLSELVVRNAIVQANTNIGLRNVMLEMAF